MSHACRLPSFLETLQNPQVLLTFDKVHNPWRLPRETTSQRPKVVREWCVLYILTSTCASRQNGVQFFDISTSKSGPRMVCFVHFDFEMCFAPQRCALFRHLNVQKWPENGVFCTFWLRHVLRAKTACNFSTSQLPKVARSWCVLCILTSKCASRHNGMQFFISHLARWLRARRFSEATFRPSGATNHWKNAVFCDFPSFSRTCIFFWLFLFCDLFSSTLLFSLALPISVFHLPILLEVWLLNFLRSVLHHTSVRIRSYLHRHQQWMQLASSSDLSHGHGCHAMALQALLIDCTPLHAAAYIGDQAITRLLWEHGAEQKTNFMEMSLRSACKI